MKVFATLLALAVPASALTVLVNKPSDPQMAEVASILEGIIANLSKNHREGMSLAVARQTALKDAYKYGPNVEKAMLELWRSKSSLAEVENAIRK